MALGRGLLAGTPRPDTPAAKKDTRKKQKYDAACVKFIGRVVRKRPASAIGAVEEVLPIEDVEPLPLDDAIADVTFDDLVQPAAPFVDANTVVHTLTCARESCGEDHGVSFEMFKSWAKSRKKFYCKNNSCSCNRWPSLWQIIDSGIRPNILHFRY